MLAVLRAVGFPVPATTLIARALFASGEGTAVTAKSEGRGGREPVVPGRSVHYEYALALALLVLIDQPVTTYRGCRFSHCGFLASGADEQEADVREFITTYRTRLIPTRDPSLVCDRSFLSFYHSTVDSAAGEHKEEAA